MNPEKLPEGDEKVQAVRSMFDTIAPRYDLVNRVMTFRMDVGWRRRTVRDLGLPKGSLVADLACGTGDFCRELQTQGHRPVGFDLSFGMLAAARTEAPLVEADILRLPVPDGCLDGVTCGFALRNLVELGAFFVELARVVRPGGHVVLSTHGEAYLDRLEEPERVMFRSGRTVVRRGGIAGSNWCTTFHPEQAVRERLARGFDVVDFVPRGAKGNPVQDVVLLRKPV